MKKSMIRPVVPFVVGLALLGCSAGRDESGPGGIVREFYRQLNAGEHEAALAHYNAMVRQGLAAPAPGADSWFADWARTETMGGQIDSVEILSETTEGQQASVTFELVYADGSTAARKVTLELEDGVWKLGLIG